MRPAKRRKVKPKTRKKTAAGGGSGKQDPVAPSHTKTGRMALGPASRTPPLRVEKRLLLDLRPSPENEEIYRPISADDAAIQELTEDIRRNGILERIIITRDDYIVSGHRRHFAALNADLGLTKVEVIIKPIWRTRCSRDKYIKILRDHNRQREKTATEQAREAIVDANPETGWTSIVDERVEKLRKSKGDFHPGLVIKAGKTCQRNKIGDEKRPMLEAAKAVIEENREHWPLTLRRIHYLLLNDPPIKNTKTKGRYTNDRLSYNDLSDLVTRGRIEGEISWESIEDETRPVFIWSTHRSVADFIREKMEGLFNDYWRDYQASQRDHVEVIVEKLTVQNIVKPVCHKYAITFTVSKGMASVTALRKVAERFKLSGRDRLVLVVMTDFDPAGNEICGKYGAAMRDDFGIEGEKIHVVKAAINPEHVRRFDLPPGDPPKEKSPTYREFVRLYGRHTWELEALPAETLQMLLDEAIRGVLNVEAFNREVEQEREDAKILGEIKARVVAALKGESGPAVGKAGAP